MSGPQGTTGSAGVRSADAVDPDSDLQTSTVEQEPLAPRSGIPTRGDQALCLVTAHGCGSVPDFDRLPPTGELTRRGMARDGSP